MSAAKTPGALPEVLPELVEYSVVREIFKWKDNKAIREAVRAGKLTRVNVNGDIRFFKITAESVRSLHADLLNYDETCKTFDITHGRMMAMRRAKKQREASPVPRIDVDLNAREVIREAYNLNKTPAPSVSLPSTVRATGPQSENEKLGAWFNAKGAAKVTAYRALDWRTKNRLIETGQV